MPVIPVCFFSFLFPSISFSLFPSCSLPLTVIHPLRPRNPLSSRTILAAALDVLLSCNRRTFHRTRVVARVCVLCAYVCTSADTRARETASYAIHFLFYTRFSIPPSYTSYHAPLTTAMSIIPEFCRNPRAGQLRSSSHCSILDCVVGQLRRRQRCNWRNT